MVAAYVKVFHSFNSTSGTVGVQSDLNNWVEWCKKDGMSLNSKKC